MALSSGAPHLEDPLRIGAAGRIAGGKRVGARPSPLPVDEPLDHCRLWAEKGSARIGWSGVDRLEEGGECPLAPAGQVARDPRASCDRKRKPMPAARPSEASISDVRAALVAASLQRAAARIHAGGSSSVDVSGVRSETRPSGRAVAANDVPPSWSAGPGSSSRPVQDCAKRGRPRAGPGGGSAPVAIGRGRSPSRSTRGTPTSRTTASPHGLESASTASRYRRTRRERWAISAFGSSRGWRARSRPWTSNP